MSGEPKPWVHVAKRFHGNTWCAKRIAPRFRGAGEPDTPRLCVARSVAACLSASFCQDDCFIYKTEAVRTNPPRDVHDALLTGERWIVPPVRLTLILSLPASDLVAYRRAMNEACSQGCISFHHRAQILQSLCDQFDGIDSIGVPWSTARDQRMGELVCAYFAKKGNRGLTSLKAAQAT